jgi:hypothetical protein
MKWLWVVIGVLAVLAVGVMIFTRENSRDDSLKKARAAKKRKRDEYLRSLELDNIHAN